MTCHDSLPKMNTMQHLMSDTDAIIEYILGGHGAFTLVSKQTGQRFTYRVKAKKVPARNGDGADLLHFVSVLRGADNTSDYSYLGTIFNGVGYRHGKRSAVSPDAASAKAFDWYWSCLRRGQAPVNKCDFWHEGVCCRCGRALTTPESIESGIGPVCAQKGNR